VGSYDFVTADKFGRNDWPHVIEFGSFLGWSAGRAGWRAVLPNKKHEFSTGWQAAQKGVPAGCTTG